jgi:hypothetical protein
METERGDTGRIGEQGILIILWPYRKLLRSSHLQLRFIRLWILWIDLLR